MRDYRTSPFQRAQTTKRKIAKAREYHKGMKRVFKGIYSYPTRKVLYQIGQDRIKRGE